jgi:rhodanese-related sulfurtransferase
MGGVRASKPALGDAERAAKVMAMYNKYVSDHERSTGKQWPAMSAEELLASGAPVEVVFVDCRTEAERGVSRIAGSIVERDMRQRLGEGAGDSLFVAFCTIGYRSGKIAAELSAAHPTARVVNLAGGVLAWTHAGGQVVDASGAESSALHVFGSKWDLAPVHFKTHTFPML